MPRKHMLISVSSIVLIIAGIIAYCVGNSIHQNNVKQTYIENLKSAISQMSIGIESADGIGNLIGDVWYNTIYKKYDTETDKYTQSEGNGFNADFNDSVDALFDDIDFRDRISRIESNKKTVLALMKELKNPPKEFEEEHKAIKKYYDAYIGLTNLAIYPEGTLDSYTNQFEESCAEARDCYEMMKIYTDE